jgi:hypothetical protein
MKRLIALMALVIPLTCSLVSAQETDTEKAAARDVLRKMADLEQSLDVPGVVKKLAGPTRRAMQ